jgi:NAD(P)H-hydrate epimerase
MKQIEAAAVHQGLSEERLMEAAAMAAAVEVLAHSPSSVGIICGSGNNGGDGYALAALLHTAGLTEVTIYSVGEAPRGLALQQRERCLRQGLTVVPWQSLTRHSFVLIDALFGIGLNRPVEGEFRQCIEWINQSSSFKFSLDTPSGLDCDRGIALGVAVRADRTLTFGLAKPGFYLQDGPQFIGQLSVHEMGLTDAILETVTPTYWLFDRASARAVLPLREPTGNKSNYGHALICAGQPGTWGAALLSAQACYRSGVGYTTLASHDDLRSFVAALPEVMTSSLSDPQLWTRKFSAIALGPGLGLRPETTALVRTLAQQAEARVVVDADAFTMVVREGLYPLPATWVATPHAGELARLLGLTARQIEEDRLTAATQAVSLLGCHVVLKGLHTVVASPDHTFRVINAGNGALAKAGTGDVLTGLIVGLLAQNMTVEDAVSLAIYVHGRVADRWIESGRSGRSLLASDIADHLPFVWAELEGLG